MNSIQQKGLDVKNCHGQGYDGTVVMSGKYSSLHKKIQGVAPHAYYVHCALHNLNLVLKDAMEAVTENYQFYDTIESVYTFFGHSIVWWQKFQNIHDHYCSNPTSKALNLTWWSGQCDAVYALKERVCDVKKCLTYIVTGGEYWVRPVRQLPWPPFFTLIEGLLFENAVYSFILWLFTWFHEP